MTSRIQSLDVLRGIAVLGLPTMNIISFSMPSAAYLNPTVFDNTSAMNHFLFSLFQIFADQKFMGLFSILFGAGIILLAEKRKERGQCTFCGHFSRMFWLLVFGILHYWFLWYGDILSIYALIALFVFPFYKSSTKFLLSITIISLSLSVILSSNAYVTEAVMGRTAKLELMQDYSPSQEHVDKIKEQRLSPSYQDNMLEYREIFFQDLDEDMQDDQNENEADSYVTDQLFYQAVCKVFGLMTLGMLLYRTGYLSGQRSRTEYQLMAQVGFIIGMSFTFAALFWNYTHNWDAQAYFEYGMLLSNIGSIAMTIAYIGLFVLLQINGYFGRATEYIASVGRMALTNYLMQSFICIVIFYGFGLGLYGSLTRLGLIPIIVLLCGFQLLFSKYWLTYFMQGPFEFLLRTLATFKIQGILKPSTSA
jgi:uncharacterized protein